ncbi:DUF11 domain-containing protein [Kibdelosporangium phytohabitans]|uniref:DUF11 domain-containing protein n=1 Tax=Kibdelosporangium phytohabitans TaxID=860235 RepID=UPI0019DDA580|nr:DUF11 domain-containing protein [Kibdelosporangium phytohabitans]MBE1468772.1 putative repeat protein (TIGR01451 family) [Kibdelosporangium phytohabitans]
MTIVLGAAVVATLAAPLSSPVFADPGVPQAPTVVFAEGFEFGQGATPQLVTGYTGPPPVSQQYTADPAWLTACNGWITSLQNSPVEPPGAACGGFWTQAQQLSAALGQWAGGDAATNHSVIGYTSANPGPDKVQIETTQPIPLSGASRFLTFSVDAAARGCQGSHPRLKFYLVDGPAAIPTFSSPIDPCVNPGAVINGTSVGTYVSNSPALFAGSSVGVRMVNGQSDSYGNDSAIDNIKILDVTPQLDKTFSAASATINSPVALTFTVTNTSELAAKTGWSFTDTLPAGLVADPSTATTTCDGGVITASPTAVGVSGNLTTGQTSCTATIQVTAAQAGTYTNCVPDVVGLNVPGCATVQFKVPALAFDAHAHGGKVIAPLIGVAPIAPSDLTCTATPGVDTDRVLNASLPTLGSLGAIHTNASGTVDSQGLRTASANSTTAQVNLLGGLVTADALTTTATAAQDSFGQITTSGSTVVTNLKVAGVPVLNPTPNLPIVIPLVGSVIVNERTTIAGGRGVSVNALHITLLQGTHIVVSHAQASLGTPCPPVG